jgi:hypothetical protein
MRIFPLTLVVSYLCIVLLAWSHNMVLLLFVVTKRLGAKRPRKLNVSSLHRYRMFSFKDDSPRRRARKRWTADEEERVR